MLNTKFGRVIRDEVEDVSARDLGEKGRFSSSDGPTESSTTTMPMRRCDRSKTTGTDRIDIAFVHDLAQDFYGNEWLSVFETARKGAFRAPDRLRDERVVGAWDLGVDRVEPIELVMGLNAPRPGGFLLAGRYSLLDHDQALERVMLSVATEGLSIIVGGP